MPRKSSPGKDVVLSQFTGVNNVQAANKLKKQELREALNVDIDDTGAVRCRAGYVSVYSGTSIHSFWSDGTDAFFVEGSNLNQLNEDLTATTLRTDLQTNLRMHFLSVDDGATYFSDGNTTGKISGGAAVSWGLSTPQLPILSASAGSLSAGRFSATVTVQTSSGLESGARASATIDLVSEGGILFSNLPNDSDADFVNIYMTPWNGDVLYLAAQVPMGTSSYLISNSYDLGRQLRTQYMDKPLSGKYLEQFVSRIFFAVDNILYYTEPYAYHLVNYRVNYIQFPETITDLAAVENGLYVGSDKTYFISGRKLSDVKLVDVVADTIVSNTMVKVSSTRFGKEEEEYPVLVWTGRYGIYMGGPGGKVTNLTSGRFVPSPATEGAAVVRDRDGTDQYAATLRDSEDSPDGIYASDVAVAEVYRDGVLVP